MFKMVKLCLLSVILVFTLFAIPAFAAKTINDATGVLTQTLGPTGIATTNLPQSVPEMIGFWIKIALSFVGTIFFILMVYAGFRWMTARGEEDQIKSARDTITMAVIGLVIIVSGYAITNLVVTRIVEGQAASVSDTTPDLSEEVIKGCCVEWVESAGDINIAINKACYINTENVCRLQGREKRGCTDQAEAGCWLFYENASRYTDDEVGNDNCAKDYCR